MKLSEMNEWLSLIANLGVLIGLFVLIVEISQNTRAIDNEASWARVSTANDTYALLAGDEDLMDIMIKYNFSPDSVGDRTSAEAARYRMVIAMIARQNEARFLTKSDNDSVTRASLIRYLDTPGQLEVYKLEMPLFSPEYAEFVSSTMRELEGN